MTEFRARAASQSLCATAAKEEHQQHQSKQRQNSSIGKNSLELAAADGEIGRRVAAGSWERQRAPQATGGSLDRDKTDNMSKPRGGGADGCEVILRAERIRHRWE